jgi:hypothetical protein
VSLRDTLRQRAYSRAEIIGEIVQREPGGTATVIVN